MVKNPGPVYVLGVGMTKFIKPRGKVDFGFEAGIKAMLDAQISYDEVDQGIGCYVYGDSTCGQRVFYQFGMTQIPIYNVNSNCSTGSSGLNMARQSIAYGAADCILVVGFEKMAPGSLKGHFEDHASPMETTLHVVQETKGITNSPFAAQMFGNAAQEYIEKYGADAKDFAEISRVNHEHSTRNPYAQFQQEYTLDEVLKSPMIHPPMTKLQCCPTSDGGAAVVLVSEAFLNKRPGLKAQAVQIIGQQLGTDSPELFSKSAIDLCGYHMTEYAAKEAFGQAKITPDDVSVVELHDCFSANEMILLNSLGLAPKGKAHELVRAGGITYGGKYVVNPSGGLISKGHPLGATGLAQCAELVWQLRGWANNRLVKDKETRYALQQNLGLGGASIVTIYKRADNKAARPVSDSEVARITGLGYNPATQAKGFTKEQVERTVSQKKFSKYALMDIGEKVLARF
ncbi:sterol carrier protein 2 [Exophiala aquamarina CBS 119918]|uniref:propanoyl-CoA C-acyltransferase n=1 Tax=Exophiala aquamarina CBS 119918 TaxID=1182545 RepID=A0A072P4L0_9EURO|nr:sterol carrier protein 2 [Exophiala aquamarina CBS 119918]KEF55049.1 sterol carrier protein 2 [Exophiala aquamarina CBS 119918]